jgi:hypothetical protein
MNVWMCASVSAARGLSESLVSRQLTLALLSSNPDMHP